MRSVLRMSIGLLLVSTGFCRAADDGKEENHSYARPIALDQATLDVLDDVGANSVGFRFHLPPDAKLTVAIVAKDDKGQPIEDLSSVHELTPPKNVAAFDTSVRLVRIDPGKFTENYNGKIRWVTHLGRSTQETWLADGYTATGSRDSWWQGNVFETIEPGKSYLLWRVKAYPKGLRGIYPDSPSTFSMQIHFHYQPMTASDHYGSTMELVDGDQEFNRVVEDPRESAAE